MHFYIKLVPFVSVLIPVSVFSNVPLMQEEGPCQARFDLFKFKITLFKQQVLNKERLEHGSQV